MAQTAVAPVQTVQYRRWGGGWRGGRGSGWWGPGLAAGIIGGVILGSQYGYGQPYGYGPGYGPGYDNGYYAPQNTYEQGYVAAPDGDSVGYCQQRFRSYDPASGTYLGYDGLRHACP
jgi:hypothetical protein